MTEKRIILGTHDVNQLHPIKYKWAHEYHTNELKGHWLPETVDMNRDINQWKDPGFINEAERRMVMRNLGFFATADTMAADNIIYNTSRHITAREALNFMTVQAYTETVHTLAYDYIIQSLSIPEKETYEAYRKISSIQSKHKFLKPFINIINKEDHLSVDDLATAVFVFGAIMEGLFFFVGFAQILGLGREGKLPGACKQYEYIMRDETRHAHFGMDLYNQIVIENPKEISSHHKSNIRSLIETAVYLEYAYALDSIKDGINMMTADEYHQYLKFIADRRAVKVGLDPIYNQHANPFPWLAVTMDLPKNTNGFEDRNTQYQAGSMDWE